MYQRQQRFQDILDQVKHAPLAVPPPPPVPPQPTRKVPARLSGPQEVYIAQFDLGTTVERLSQVKTLYDVDVNMVPVGVKHVAFEMRKTHGKQHAVVEGRVSITRRGRTRVVVSGKYQRNRQLINLLVAFILGITTLIAFSQDSIIVLLLIPAILIIASTIIDRRTRAMRAVMYALHRAIYHT